MKILLFIFLIYQFSFSFLSKKSLEEKFERIEALNKKGKYPAALRKIKRIRKSHLRKGTMTDSIHVLVNLKEAHSQISIGNMKKALLLIDESVGMSDTVNVSNRTIHADILLDATQLYIKYGYYKRANKSLSNARVIYENNPGQNPSFDDKINLLKAKIQIGKGFYVSGIEIIDNYLSSHSDTVKYSSKKERRSKQEEYLDILIWRANALRYLGEYERADSNFIQNERLAIKELGKRNQLSVQNKFSQILMFEENGMDEKPLIKYYKDLYKRVSKGRTEGHDLVVNVRERLMSNYYKLEKKSKLIDLENDMRRTYRRYHKKRNSIYTAFESVYKFPKKISTADLAGLENDIANILGGENAFPQYHARRIELLNIAYLSAITDINKLDNAQEYLNVIINIEKELLGEDAPGYHMARLRLANFFIDNTDNFTEASKIYKESWDNVVSKEYSSVHSSYIETLSHIAVLSAENDEYLKAKNYLDEAQYLTRVKWDNTDIKYAEKLGSLARLHTTLGNYTLSRGYIDEAKEILKKQNSIDEQRVYLSLLASEIPLLIVYGDYKEAESNYDDYLKIKEKNEVPIADPGTLLEDVAELNLMLGRYEEVISKLDQAIEFKEVRYNSESRLMIKPLTLYARYHLTQGEYASAEKKARKALQIARNTYGDKSLKQVDPLRALAQLYKNIGDYPRSQQILKNVVDIQSAKLEEGHTDLGITYSEYALVKYLANDDKNEVEKYFKQAESIVGATLGSNNPYYAEILKNLAISKINAGEYEESINYLNVSSDIWKDKINKRNNLYSAEIDMLYGDISYFQREFKDAEKRYLDAAKKYESFFNDEHPEYLKAMSKLSRSEYMREDYRNARKTIEEVLGKYQAFIREYFPSLSEREKAKYWGTIKGDYEYYNSVLLAQKKMDDEMVGSMYNNALLTKSLLLNSSIKMKERIMSSGDEELIDLYLEWSNNKDRLTRTLAMSDEEIKEAGIDVGNLTFSLNSLEKQLVAKSSLFSETFDSRVTVWQEVQNAILPNDVALEIVRFRHFDQYFTDKIYYAVLGLSGQKNTTPSLVLLENGKEMETKNLTIYRNSMKFKIDDPASYQVYWEPLEKQFGGASTIFLSPDGVYNQINLESIKLPENDKTYVLDQENIILVNNTKDLFFRKLKDKKVQEAKIAALYGNPKFYLDTQPGIKIDEYGGQRATDEVISQLPGTELEIKELAEILGEDGWLTQNHMFDEATEGSIKSVNNPRIFHIATHGFFKVESDTSGSKDLIAREITHNPLMRSGLLLKGAGDILNTTEYNFNINDGILTAYEAMNLNLDQTELVVLSACETGLGAVEAGEGVFGLQRAFLVAGAKAVVMSLFKVSDDATQKLMVNFYKRWLKTGDARRSFVLAKQEIRDEYKDPIYWAPFVMIGLN